MMMPQHPEWQEEASQKEYDCSIFHIRDVDADGRKKRQKWIACVENRTRG